MKIKDIVNRDIVNLENCESEPIHIPGSIQPHGFMLALRPADHTIVFCSGNVSAFIGVTHEQLLDKHIRVMLDEQSEAPFMQYLGRHASYADAPFRITVNKVQLECVSHHNGECIILEFEKESEEPTDHHALYFQTRQFIHHIETSSTLKSLCQNVADEIRQITGYDRVMVYRFDEQYNGEVFAESLNDNIEPFLGLHYPHTDIPAQARELYIRNLLRLIVDVNYTPVPVFTIDDGSTKNLDMSHTALRSVSPIHIQYLQNMGVGATLTISLIHEEKLWGLIACHHYSPKHLSNAMKVSAKLQGHFLTSQIKVRELNEEYGISKETDRNLQTLITDNIRMDRSSLTHLVKRKELLHICNASGVAIMIDGHIYHSGDVPGEAQLDQLLQWLNAQPALFSITDKLSSVYPAGEAIQGIAAGIIFHSLGNNNSIIWFRHETEREVHWGGDPQKAILRDEKGLHPRKSFDLWREIVKGRSTPWLRPELNAAAQFTHFLQRQVHLLFITEEETKYRELSHKLQEANAELENINWISAHDLKEPLRKIQVFASRILEDDPGVPAYVRQKVDRMQAAARRMSMLLHDLLSYSHVAKMTDAMQEIALDEVLDFVLDEIKEETEERNATITHDHLPVIRGIPFMLKQLFLNLFRNSLKFRRTGVDPVITVQYREPVAQPLPALKAGKQYHQVIVSDNGIGFSNDFSKSIFDVFTRLNNQEDFDGSGIGLALCKKIMSNHEGAIMAIGKEGEGATFTLYFPVA